MRRVLLVCVLFLSTQSFGLVRFGLQGGLSSANVAVEPAITSTARGGMALGGALEFGLGGDWNLQFDALYVSKGFVIPASAVVGETTVRLDYFEIPALFKYSFDLLLLKPFLFAGPYLGIKLKADQVIGSTTTTLSNYSSSDLGLTFGGGLEIAFTPVTSIFASLRYDLGLSNLQDSTPGTSVKNKGFLLMGGFLFGI